MLSVAELRWEGTFRVRFRYLNTHWHRHYRFLGFDKAYINDDFGRLEPELGPFKDID